MYSILRVVLLIILFVIAIITGSQDNTFKPFQRSRYSLRWGKIRATKTTTTATTTILPSEITVNSENGSDSFTTPIIAPASVTASASTSIKSNEKSLVPTSLPDYDYYGNNELEENSFS